CSSDLPPPRAESRGLHDRLCRLAFPVHGPRDRGCRRGGVIERHRRAIAWTACAACMLPLAGGCGGPQSTLDPAGPAAGAIATSWWLMAAGAIATRRGPVRAVALGARSTGAVGAARAQRGRRRLAPAAGRRLVLAGGVLLPATLLVARRVCGTLASDEISGERAQAGQVV